MPVSGYVLYEFLPVEEMQNVAEAVLRVFHKYGDYEHRQRNRMKFVVKQLGWETFRAKVMEELDAFVAAGGAPLRLTAEQLKPQGAPDWQPAPAPSVNAVAAAAVTPVVGPGIMPGSVKLQTVRRSVRALGPDQRGAAEAGRLSPRDRAPAARRHDRRSDARARRPGRGLRRRRRCGSRWSRTCSSSG